jgi:DNA-binding MarR family transcriptional regulator
VATHPLPFDPIGEAHRQWVAHGWHQAADGMAALTSVIRAQQIFMARVDAVLRPLDLTFSRYEVLMVLSFSRAGALPLNKIGARLQVHPTSITNAVDRLEQQRLLRRVPHPTDGRTTLAEITSAGRLTAQEATEKLNTEVFERPGLNDHDVADLIDVLKNLRRESGDFHDAPAPAPG